MTPDQVKSIVEDLLESTIPIKEYHIIIDKDNGNSTLTMCRCDKGAFPHMYELSEIFNSYSTDWKVSLLHNEIVVEIK